MKPSFHIMSYENPYVPICDNQRVSIAGHQGHSTLCSSHLSFSVTQVYPTAPMSLYNLCRSVYMAHVNLAIDEYISFHSGMYRPPSPPSKSEIRMSLLPSFISCLMAGGMLPSTCPQHEARNGARASHSRSTCLLSSLVLLPHSLQIRRIIFSCRPFGCAPNNTGTTQLTFL